MSIGDIFLIIFEILFIALTVVLIIFVPVWVFCKVRFNLLITKQKYNELYNEKKQELIDEILNMPLFNFFNKTRKILLTLFYVCFAIFPFAVVALLIDWFLLPFNIISGNDSEENSMFNRFAFIFVPIFCFQFMCVFLLIILYLIKSICVYDLCYKKLKSSYFVIED